MPSPIPWIARVARALRDARTRHRWRALRARGLTIGSGCFIPDSTWIDSSCCYAIEIGNDVGFGPQCLILGHDAQMKGALGVARVARITVHDSCRIGARTVILPGVEIGPRTIVFAGSVVSRSLPPDTICAGSPARPIGNLQNYIDVHSGQLETSPTFPFAEYGDEPITAERRAELTAALKRGAIYIRGTNGPEGWIVPGAEA